MWFHLHAATKAFEDVNFGIHSPTTIEGNIETRHRGCGVCSIWWLEINLLDDFNNISSHVWHVILFRRVFIRSWFAACRVDNIHYVHHFTIRWTVIILSHNSNILYNTIPWLLFRCWYILFIYNIYLSGNLHFRTLCSILVVCSQFDRMFHKMYILLVIATPGISTTKVDESPSVAFNDPCSFRNSSQYFIEGRQNNEASTKNRISTLLVEWGSIVFLVIIIVIISVAYRGSCVLCMSV